jgi:hypothetical protein
MKRIFGPLHNTNRTCLPLVFYLFLVSLAIPTFLQAASTPAKKVLFVYGVPSEAQKADDETYERMINTLDGLGLPYYSLHFEQLGSADLTDYQLVVVAWSSSYWLEPIPDAIEAKIIDAIDRGINCLWIGPGIWGKQTDTQLPQAFGLAYVGYSNAHGYNLAEFADLTGALTRFHVKSVAPNREYVVRVNLIQATAEGSYYIGDTLQPYPFVTKYQAAAGKGKAAFISMNIMDWWKETEAEDTYARTEVLVKYIRQLTSQGFAAKHPVKDGKEATFLLRLEDYTPGGAMMLADPLETWIDRLDNLIYFVKKTGLRLNLAIIPRYEHPCLAESHTWGDTDQGIPLLKRYARTVLADGGSLIVHGFKHQVGQGQDDFSGGDYEMCLFPLNQSPCDLRPNICIDPAKPEDPYTFLPYGQQKDRTDSARAEMAAQFNYTPLIWETPHYSGNETTYTAANDSGFQFFTESDTMLFPNYFGYRNRAQGLILSLPETAFDFRDTPALIAQMEPIKKDHILPRLVRLNAPYYTFYHNTSQEQYQSLLNVINKARTYNLWYPSLEEFGLFWKNRENALVSGWVDEELRKMTADVSGSFAGLTLTFRLPNGAVPGAVFINGAPAVSTSKQVEGVHLVYVVLPAGTTAQVEVHYK